MYKKKTNLTNVKLSHYNAKRLKTWLFYNIKIILVKAENYNVKIVSLKSVFFLL